MAILTLLNLYSNHEYTKSKCILSLLPIDSLIELSLGVLCGVVQYFSRKQVSCRLGFLFPFFLYFFKKQNILLIIRGTLRQRSLGNLLFKGKLGLQLTLQ